jgi:proteasome accessory factor A
MEDPRIFGVETEFGCLVADENLGTPEQVVEEIKDHLFYERKIGAIDHHARDDVFEPAESGGFLMNGARLYVDAVGSHLEYATAECRTLKDLVANDRAGQRLIVQAVKELGLSDEVSIYNNSVDHFGGHTFGCHENYLVQAHGELLNGNLHLLVPFLVTRQIYSAVGRVGGHILYAGGAPTYEDMEQYPVDYIWVSQVYHVGPDDGVKFQLSQRADHILKSVASKVRFNRSLVNPKWETMYTQNGMTRLHLLFGEANQNEFAYALKVGTTSLAIRACELGLVDSAVLLSRPVLVLRDISRDESYRWECEAIDGRVTSAIEVQRRFLLACQIFAGESDQTDWILREWALILDALEADPLSLGHKLDWVAKRNICLEYMASEGIEWGDDALQSVDLEYHNIDPAQSLFYAYQSERILRENDITFAQTDPPADTRARTRGRLVEAVVKRPGSPIYAFDWSGVQFDRQRFVDLSDPLELYENPVDQWGKPIF